MIITSDFIQMNYLRTQCNQTDKNIKLSLNCDTLEIEKKMSKLITSLQKTTNSDLRTHYPHSRVKRKKKRIDTINYIQKVDIQNKYRHLSIDLHRNHFMFLAAKLYPIPIYTTC